MSDHLHKPVKVKGDLELHYVDDIAIIVMNGGENRINATFYNNFNELLDEIERNPSCKGLITTGRGKFFCNGYDLKWIAQNPEAQTEFLSQIFAFTFRMLVFPLPTLAAINGHAFAGGAFLAYYHDLRIQCQDKGWLCLNEVFNSMQFHPVAFHWMRTKLGGGHHYTDAIILGKRYTGPEALKGGLVNSVAPSSHLLAESIQLLKSLNGKSGYPRESLVLMKSDVYRDALDIYKTVKLDKWKSPFPSKI